MRETPQEALLCNMELSLRRTFYPLGYPVEILTNNVAVLEAAEESFGHLKASEPAGILQVRIGVSPGVDTLCPREPVRREYNHLFSLIADANNHALLDLSSCSCFTWTTESALRHKLYFRYNFIEKPIYVLLGSSVVTDLHAACVSRNGKGVLLCGDSGAGKSTLAYGCARAGWVYTSDDTSYLINASEVPRVFGHSHRVRFRPTAKAVFPELEGRALASRMEGKPSIEILTSELPGIVERREAAIHGIIYLNRSESGTGRLTPLPDGEAILRLCAQLYSAGDVRARQEKALQVFARTPAYELHYRALDQAIDQLNQLTSSV